MKKVISKGNTTYTIEVMLDFTVVRIINGSRWHRVIVTNDIDDIKEIKEIKDISQIEIIEGKLVDKTLHSESKEEAYLKILGYK